MKFLAAALLATAALPLAACGGSGDDKLGDQVEDVAENRADALEATAENMESQAEAIRESGDEQEDAIDDADVNAEAMSNTEKGALVNGSETLR